MTAEQIIALGVPLQVRVEGPGGEHWRVVAEAWALPDGGFAWADLGWDTNDTGHPFHVCHGPSTPGEFGGPMAGGCELMLLAEGDPDRAQWDAWQAYRAGEGSRATRAAAAAALNRSGLLPDGAQVAT